MAVAYYLLKDTEHSPLANIRDMAEDLELSTHLECIDYIYYLNEHHEDYDPHHINISDTFN